MDKGYLWKRISCDPRLYEIFRIETEEEESIRIKLYGQLALGLEALKMRIESPSMIQIRITVLNNSEKNSAKKLSLKVFPMDSIEQHIAKDKEILSNPTASPPASSHRRKTRFRRVRGAPQGRDRSRRSHDPSPLELSAIKNQAHLNVRFTITNGE